MTKLEEITNILHQKNASLVVKDANGQIKEYYQDRIKDIKEILTVDTSALKDASIADKVIGKVAASILTVAGVKEIYADCISEFAISILEEHEVSFQYRQRVAYIKNKENTGMCPMETRYMDELDIYKIYGEIMGK